MAVLSSSSAFQVSDNSNNRQTENPTLPASQQSTEVNIFGKAIFDEVQSPISQEAQKDYDIRLKEAFSKAFQDDNKRQNNLLVGFLVSSIARNSSVIRGKVHRIREGEKKETSISKITYDYESGINYLLSEAMKSQNTRIVKIICDSPVAQFVSLGDKELQASIDQAKSRKDQEPELINILNYIAELQENFDKRLNSAFEYALKDDHGVSEVEELLNAPLAKTSKETSESKIWCRLSKAMDKKNIRLRLVRGIVGSSIASSISITESGLKEIYQLLKDTITQPSYLESMEKDHNFFSHFFEIFFDFFCKKYPAEKDEELNNRIVNLLLDSFKHKQDCIVSHIKYHIIEKNSQTLFDEALEQTLSYIISNEEDEEKAELIRKLLESELYKSSSRIKNSKESFSSAITYWLSQAMQNDKRNLVITILYRNFPMSESDKPKILNDFFGFLDKIFAEAVKVKDNYKVFESCSSWLRFKLCDDSSISEKITSWVKQAIENDNIPVFKIIVESSVAKHINDETLEDSRPYISEKLISCLKLAIKNREDSKIRTILESPVARYISLDDNSQNSGGPSRNKAEEEKNKEIYARIRKEMEAVKKRKLQTK